MGQVSLAMMLFGWQLEKNRDIPRIYLIERMSLFFSYILLARLGIE